VHLAVSAWGRLDDIAVRQTTLLHKCANPRCIVRFRFLGQGKLFQMESEYLEAASALPSRTAKRSRSWRRIERYWLCDECACTLTLTFDQSHGIVTVPLPETPKRRILIPLQLREFGLAGRSARAAQGSRGVA
jgi:hypothetical protein